MKKMFVMMGMMMVLPALADPTIGYDNGSYTYNESTTDGSNMCVNNVLETYSGTANLTAQWEANKIKLRWYNNNTQIIPSTESQTCDYAGALNLPANPTRTGYTFAGWRVRETMNFSTLGLYVGLQRWSKGFYNNNGYCIYTAPGRASGDTLLCDSDHHFVELETYEWQVQYDNNEKTLYGTAYCSAKVGNNYNNTWPQANKSDWQTTTREALDEISGQKKYCWCQATGYKATSTSKIYGSSSFLGWVYPLDYGANGSSCDALCASACATNAQTTPEFLNALFSPIN